MPTLDLLCRVEYCIREFALLTINDTMIVLFHDCCYSTRAERDPNKRPLYALLINEKQTTANSALLSSVIINKRQRQQITTKLQKDYKTLLLDKVDIILNKRCSCPLNKFEIWSQQHWNCLIIWVANMDQTTRSDKPRVWAELHSR